MKRRPRSGRVRSPVSGYLDVLDATHGDGLQFFVRTRRVAKVQRVAPGLLLARVVTAPFWFDCPKGLGTCASLALEWRELHTARFKESPALCDRPPYGFELLFLISQTFYCANSRSDHSIGKRKRKTKTTLNGGSLGSCVDEERSQLRELM